jgi:hypothetical protein
MLRSTIGARLMSLGAATLLIAGIFAQATPVLAASPAHLHPSLLGAGTPSLQTARGRSTNLRSLAAHGSSKLPFDAVAASAALRKTVSPAGSVHPDTVGPPAPDLATASGAPAATKPVAVAGQTGGGAGTSVGPDAGIAAGPDEVIQTDNTSLDVFDRAGNSLIAVNLPTFFALPELSTGSSYTTFDSDPRVVFDTLRQRWIISELSWDCATNTFSLDPAHFGHGYIDFAISDTADPLGFWSFASFFWNDFLPAGPSFGASTDKLALTAGLYTMGVGGSTTTPGCISSTFDGAEAVAMDWTDLGPNFLSSKLHNQSGNFATIGTLRAATQEPVTDANVRMIGIGTGSGDVVYVNLTGSAVKQTVLQQIIDLTSADVVPAFSPPPDPAQTGGTLTTGLDGAPDSVIYDNGTLGFSSTYPCMPSGDSTLRDCIRVTTLGSANAAVQPTRIGDTLLGSNGFDSSFGGIAFSGNGVLTAVYTRSSGSSFASSYTQYNLPTDTPILWSAPQVLTAGTATYAGTGWGAYLTVAPDPQDPSAAWVGDPWANGSGGWSTTVHELVVGGAGAGYFPISPTRMLDSRSASGAPLGFSGVLVANVPRTFAVAGVTITPTVGSPFIPVPTGAVAITGNLTVTQQTALGYLSLTPTATANPSSSTLNFPVGDNRANNVTIALGPGGTLSVVYKATAGKHTHVLLDVTGYFLAGSGQTYTPLAPDRVLDSRTDPVTHAFAANVAKAFHVAGFLINGVTIPSSATAITANLTVTGQSKAGYVSLTPTNNNSPTTSTINFPVGDNRANGLTIPLDPITGDVSAVYKATSGTVNLILDVTGYYSSSGGAGLLFHPLNPGRRIDTRLVVGTLGFGNGLSGAQGTTSRNAVIAGHDGVPAAAAAITGNLTVTAQTGAGFVSVTDTSIAHPLTSTINFPLADNRANGITVPLGGGDLWFIYQTLATKHVQLILDITGYFE